MDLCDSLIIVVVVALSISVVAALTALPGFIAHQKGEYFYFWWLGTVCTGCVPGFIASFLCRRYAVPPVKAFGWGIVGYLVFGWVVVGVVYMLS